MEKLPVFRLCGFFASEKWIEANENKNRWSELIAAINMLALWSYFVQYGYCDVHTIIRTIFWRILVSSNETIILEGSVSHQNASIV